MFAIQELYWEDVTKFASGYEDKVYAVFDDISAQLSKREKDTYWPLYEIAEHNTALAEAARQAGVEKPVEYAIFQNWGYKGLYGGMDMKAIH